MKLTLKRGLGAFGMEVSNETGQTVRYDASEAIGGQGFGVRPMEGVAASLAACSSIDVLLILNKQKLNPTVYSVKIDAERTDAVPAIFNKIHLVFLFEGDLPREKVERAVELSMTKYCSVTKILEPSCDITYSVSLNKSI